MTTTTATTMANVDNKALGVLMTRPHAQAHGIFILRHANAMTTTTIGDNKQQVSDNEALCASAQHNSRCAQAHMLRVKIDATTSQATSNLDRRKLHCQT
jgi:hypothetical protein